MFPRKLQTFSDKIMLQDNDLRAPCDSMNLFVAGQIESRRAIAFDQGLDLLVFAALLMFIAFYYDRIVACFQT
jgi:hypothetical protein